MRFGQLASSVLFSFLLCNLTLVSPLFGQEHPGSITGRAVDRAGAVLQGAHVEIEPSRIATATNAQGEFTVTGLAPGSYLAITHAAIETVAQTGANEDSYDRVEDLYNQKTATPFGPRTWDQTSKFFERATLVEPGLVWFSQWRPTEGETDFADDPRRSGGWAGLAAIDL